MYTASVDGPLGIATPSTRGESVSQFFIAAARVVCFEKVKELVTKRLIRYTFVYICVYVCWEVNEGGLRMHIPS